MERSPQHVYTVYTLTAVKRSPDSSAGRPGCWSSDSHVIPESISAPYKELVAGREAMVT